MVNVNVVYRTVLYILNKEQRGFLTPAEFNKVAEQVQLEIFETYFEELNQQLRVSQTNNEYADRQKNLEEKIAVFETNGNCTYVGPHYTLPDNTHRIGTISHKDKSLQQVQRNEYLMINRSPLTRPTESFPLFFLEGTGVPSAAPSKITVFPNSINAALPIYYIKRPISPTWAYTVNAQTGGYVYQETADPSAIPATGSVQFELHPSEQVNIILNILMYSGIIIRDPQIVNAASGMIKADEVNEKS